MTPLRILLARLLGLGNTTIFSGVWISDGARDLDVVAPAASSL
jgi:hypothetical protein